MTTGLVLVWRDASRTEEKVRAIGDVTLGHGCVVFKVDAERIGQHTVRVIPLGGLWEYRLED